MCGPTSIRCRRLENHCKNHITPPFLTQKPRIDRTCGFCIFVCSGTKRGCGHANQCRQVGGGEGDFCLSESKCTVSARILHGFKTCRGCFSLQNTTKSAEITRQKITLPCLKITMTRNFHKLRRTGGLLS